MMKCEVCRKEIKATQNMILVKDKPCHQFCEVQMRVIKQRKADLQEFLGLVKPIFMEKSTSKQATDAAVALFEKAKQYEKELKGTE